MSRNRLRLRWEQGATALGAWCSTGSPVVTELIARESPDFVLFDCEHGAYGYESLLSCLRAVPAETTVPVVRVASDDPAVIGRVLDAGAHCVIVPMVETAEQARRVVAAFRYPPAGGRSFGPFRASQFFGRDPERLAAEPACLVMIESRRGVENAAEIAAVPGVDGLFIGPADLAVSLGLPPSMSPLPGVHAEAIETVRSAGAANGIVVGMPCADLAAAQAMSDAGYRFLTIGSDALWIGAAARQAFAPPPG